MLKIAAATDFSNVSIHACEYALQLAQALQAEFYLFHTFHIPSISPESPVFIPSIDDLGKDAMSSLELFKNSLLDKFKYSSEIKCISAAGFFVDELADFTQQNNIDLVIIGTSGAGYITEHLLGSNTTRVIKNVMCTTLAVPEQALFEGVNSLMLACDFENYENHKALAKIKFFAEKTSAKLQLLHVLKNADMPDIDKAASGVNTISYFEGMNHTVHFLANNNTVEAINYFVAENHVSWVVMIPHPHGFFYRLSHESKTEKLAFHTQKPLLIVHE
jgi:nucleotide-binding universal stress UspA family protein